MRSGKPEGEMSANLSPKEALDYLVRMARTPIQNCSLADLEEAEAVLRAALNTPELGEGAGGDRGERAG